jgi:hypothetical protein
MSVHQNRATRFPDGSPGNAQLESTRRAATAPLLVSFAASNTGAWRIDRITPVVGDSLAGAPRLDVIEGGDATNRPSAAWTLRGSTSNMRYTKRSEVEQLVARQEGLGRPSATRAALIPIRKTETWWTMAQDERRAVFEEQSRHIAIGLRYLPGLARRLHHCRELGEAFDFLTWFEYAPQDSGHSKSLVRAFEQPLSGGLSIARSISGSACCRPSPSLVRRPGATSARRAHGCGRPGHRTRPWSTILEATCSDAASEVAKVVTLSRFLPKKITKTSSEV